jgi:hypothetical protein
LDQRRGQYVPSIHISNFKLLLLCVRKWRAFAIESKAQRAQLDELQLENLAISIHYHEQSLIHKAIYGLKQHLKRSHLLKRADAVVSRRH